MDGDQSPATLCMCKTACGGRIEAGAGGRGGIDKETVKEEMSQIEDEGDSVLPTPPAILPLCKKAFTECSSVATLSLHHSLSDLPVPSSPDCGLPRSFLDCHSPYLHPTLAFPNSFK